MQRIFSYTDNYNLNSAFYWIFLVAFMFSYSGCKRAVEISAENETRYKHNLFSSEDECRRINPSGEISCYETVSFNKSGQADILLAGSDIIIRCSYKKKGDTVTVEKSPGLYKSISFVMSGESELVRIDNNTKWIRY